RQQHLHAVDRAGVQLVDQSHAQRGRGLQHELVRPERRQRTEARRRVAGMAHRVVVRTRAATREARHARLVGGLLRPGRPRGEGFLEQHHARPDERRAARVHYAQGDLVARGRAARGR
ncbi:MAG: hypothetical protein ACK56I_31460, partial [bacterium]